MITKILVALDTSTAAQTALALGTELAQGLKVPILLLAVVEPSREVLNLDPVMALSAQEMFLELDAERLESTQARLETFSQTLLGQGLQVEATVLRGQPDTQICQFAEKQGVDLIVMGSRGFSPLKQAFLGSISNYVLHHATCPVLIAKE